MYNIRKEIREATLALMDSRKFNKKEDLGYRLERLAYAIQNILECLDKFSDDEEDID